MDNAVIFVADDVLYPFGVKDIPSPIFGHEYKILSPEIWMVQQRSAEFSTKK